MGSEASGAVGRARGVKLMIFDVDGVLTDGRLWYGADGEALKAFHSFDGHGIKMLAAAGVQTAILSGRSSPAVSARAAELGIPHVLQGIARKRETWTRLLERAGVVAQACGFMGDELVDLGVLVRCGFSATTREAPEDVRNRVHYVATAPAGAGAAREVCEFVLRAQGRLDTALEEYLD